jgi:ribosomal protein S18 acetylase RimI-like enzyme
MAAHQIHLARVQETPAGQALLQGVLNHARQYVEESFGHRLVGIEGAQLFEMLHRDVDAAEHRVYAIDLHNGISKTVGFITLGLGYSHWDGGYVHFLVIDERYRGAGHARRAVQLLEEMAAAETSRMRLKAYPPDSEVVGFWQAMGYADCGRFPVSFTPPAGLPMHYTLLEKTLMTQRQAGRARA